MVGKRQEAGPPGIEAGCGKREGRAPTDSAQLHSTSLQDVYQNIQGSQPRDVKEVKYTV